MSIEEPTTTDNDEDSHNNFTPQLHQPSDNKFKEKLQTGDIGLDLIRRYMSLRYPFYVFVLYLIIEVAAMATIFFSDVWLKFWLQDVQKFKLDCLDRTNGTTECDPNLMDLPNADYYRTVYIGESYISFRPTNLFNPLFLVVQACPKVPQVIR